MHEQRIGHISLARLTALRLTELEVHHADLDVGYRVTDWPAAFTRICLHLRTAWLDSHLRTVRQPPGLISWAGIPTRRSPSVATATWPAPSSTPSPAPDWTLGVAFRKCQQRMLVSNKELIKIF